jgi:hypothetical protein
MSKKIEYTIGQKIGNCIFLCELEMDIQHNNVFRMGKFLCNCGKEFTAKINSVKGLNTKSCGCLIQERDVVSDIQGKVFGRLTVLNKSTVKVATSRTIRWLCKCDCGNYKIVDGSLLRGGNTTSCGCYKIENTKRVNTKHGFSRRGNKTAEYGAYYGLLFRCYNKKSKSYPDYGERGIKVCDRWLGENGFINFLADMGERPSDKHSVDRINNEGDYEPTNCRWAIKKQQANNTRYNKMVTYNGKTQSLAMWCDELNLKYGTTQVRMWNGWTAEQAFTLPKGTHLRFLK